MSKASYRIGVDISEGARSPPDISIPILYLILLIVVSFSSYP